MDRMVKISFLVITMILAGCNLLEFTDKLKTATEDLKKSTSETVDSVDRMICSIQELSCLIEITSSENKLNLDKALCIRIKGEYPCYYNNSNNKEQEIESIKQVLTQLSIECRDIKWPDNKTICDLSRSTKEND